MLDPATARAVETDVLPQAGAQTCGRLAARARRAATRLDPAAAAARCRQAREARRAGTWGLDDGVAVLQVTGPAETVAGAWARVDAIARRSQDDARRALRGLEAREGVAAEGDEASGVPSLDRLRADTVLRLLAGTHDLTEQPSPSVSVVVDVLVPLGTVLSGSDAPAELSGVGPLPADVARALAAGSAWRRVLVSPEGRVPSTCTAGAAAPGDGARHGPTAYRPSEALARAVRARDVTCRFPGCRRAARRCDVDHTVPHPDGPTAACNLACLCRLHHRAKHRAGWRLAQLGDGRLRWTSPSGLVATTDAPSLLDLPPPQPVRVASGAGEVVGPTGQAARAEAQDTEDEPPWWRRPG